MAENRKRWSTEEVQLFFCCVELYRNDFYSYTKYLDRSYSQIKSFYHNWLKKQSSETKERFQVDGRGGRHVAYRNLVQIESVQATRTVPNTTDFWKI
ncbi:SANT/Myb_domain [Hexamita inflata]|uniref:SANT/Myb domain n=1 Tax=Hexamita inflata TaxID=28002 RepID=A0AA86UAR4_9EUKA|nr:SANT/Myb domain [Hexamita inflata]